MGNDSVGSGELTVMDTDHIDHMETSCSTTGTETMDRTGERTTGSKNSPMDNTEDSEMTVKLHLLSLLALKQAKHYL
ncbi:hypothetical protein ACOMHN_065445 [Nucella lapillus]